LQARQYKLAKKRGIHGENDLTLDPSGNSQSKKKWALFKKTSSSSIDNIEKHNFIDQDLNELQIKTRKALKIELFKQRLAESTIIPSGITYKSPSDLESVMGKLKAGITKTVQNNKKN